MGDTACKLKIILDSGRAAGLAESMCDAVQALSDQQTTRLTDEVAYPIIKNIIAAEHALEWAHDQLLDVVGYSGPRPSGPYVSKQDSPSGE